MSIRYKIMNKMFPVMMVVHVVKDNAWDRKIYTKGRFQIECVQFNQFNFKEKIFHEIF